MTKLLPDRLGRIAIVIFIQLVVGIVLVFGFHILGLNLAGAYTLSGAFAGIAACKLGLI